jgi:hypothetical protein
LEKSRKKAFYMAAYGIESPALDVEIFARYGGGMMAVYECYSMVHEGLRYCLFHLKHRQRCTAVLKFILSVCRDKANIKLIHGYSKPHVKDVSNDLFVDPLFEVLIKHVMEAREGVSSWMETHGGGLLALYAKRTGFAGLSNKGIYVLRMDSSEKPFFYVGKSDDISRRILQHMSGGGAVCITGEPFTRVKPMTKGISLHECV